MRGITLCSAIISSVVVLMAGCTSTSSQKEQKAYTPHIDPSEFTPKIDNEYFPMKPGTTFLYEGKGEREEMSVTHQTKKVMGVECVVVDDRAWEGGQLIEKTYDWFAQDKEGSVWYFGEDTKEYEDGKVTSTKGCALTAAPASAATRLSLDKEKGREQTLVLVKGVGYLRWPAFCL
jgi:hypothetical protein